MEHRGYDNNLQSYLFQKRVEKAQSYNTTSKMRIDIANNRKQTDHAPEESDIEAAFLRA